MEDECSSGPVVNPEINKSSYWNTIYIENESPRWNLGQTAPPIADWLEANPAISGRVLIPGCGYGHDARAFAERGFDALAVDFAPLAIERGQALHSECTGKLKFEQADFFDLPQRYAEGFDFIYEYTCFVAFPPERRPEYVETVLNLLKPGGKLIGCFYNHGKEGGPPFNATREEVTALFGTDFELQTLEVAKRSIERRQGKELWVEFVKPPMNRGRLPDL
ncbi:MAG: methyltransferase domain-containing protein [Planctomycetota bacterium]|jgi:SAM-dependent methyltransferase